MNSERGISEPILENIMEETNKQSCLFSKKSLIVNLSVKTEQKIMLTFSFYFTFSVDPNHARPAQPSVRGFTVPV